MVGLGILTISLFIALLFAAYKYQQLEADIELYDNLLEDYNDRDIILREALLDKKNGVIRDLGYHIDRFRDAHGLLESTIDMLAEAEVARNFPEEVNE